MKGTLTILSWGLTPSQMTVETVVVLRSMDEIFSCATDGNTLSYLESYGFKIRSLFDKP